MASPAEYLRCSINHNPSLVLSRSPRENDSQVGMSNLAIINLQRQVTKKRFVEKERFLELLKWRKGGNLQIAVIH